MNLAEMRSKVKNIMDYQPELASYNKQVDTLINDAYMTTWVARSWTFAQKTVFLNVYPDLDYTLTAKNASVADMSRRVTFSGAIRTLDEGIIWEGQIFECQGREYGILKVVSNTEIRLAEPFRGTTNTDDTTWVIKHRYYDLPADCMDVLSLAHRDAPYPGNGTEQGKLIPLSQRREEELNLRQDETATFAEGYIFISPHSVPPGEKISGSLGADAAADIPDNTYLEFCWAFVEDGGKVGPLSEPVTVKTVNVEGLTNKTTVTLTFLSHDDVTVAAPTFSVLTDTHPNPWEGMKKRLFFNQNFDRKTGERLGLPLWRHVTRTGTTPLGQYDHLPLDIVDETGTATVTALKQINPGNPRYVENDGQWLRIRPFPRPIGYDKKYNFAAAVDQVSAERPEQYFRQLELRYIYKPIYLSSNTDTPEMPYEAHQLVVYRALEDLYVKANNLQMVETYRRRVEAESKRLESRYLQRKDQGAVRGQFGVVGTRVWYDVDSLKKLN